MTNFLRISAPYHDSVAAPADSFRPSVSHVDRAVEVHGAISQSVAEKRALACS